ncbi:MAG: hypothetical protein Q7262_03435 [Bacteroidales bacterium]|nr:hypothetical protein [Bacteroidales bacterium]
MFFIENRRRKALKKIETDRVVRFMPLSEVRSVGVIFDINEDNIIDTIKRFTEYLDNRSIKFQALAVNYTKSLFPEGFVDFRIKIINRASFNSIGAPIDDAVTEFANQNHDLYIDLSSQYNFTYDYISRLSNASFKVGRCGYDNNPFDLVLASDPEAGSKHFIDSVIHYLSAIRSA